MLIGGFQKFSLIDYPGKFCAIIFTQGCNFRCPYCHNPELVLPEKFNKPIPEKEIFSFLKQRVGKLDAVEITGGEPTLQSDLLDFMQKIKKMGFLLKLDSNGSNPEILKKAIELGCVDYFAMDVKAPLDRYQEVTCSKVDPKKIYQSIEIIMNSGLDYEFRTTIVKSLLSSEDIIEIGKLIKGAKLYALQKFISQPSLVDQKFINQETYSDDELARLKKTLEAYIEKVIIR